MNTNNNNENKNFVLKINLEFCESNRFCLYKTSFDTLGIVQPIDHLKETFIKIAELIRQNINNFDLNREEIKEKIEKIEIGHVPKMVFNKFQKTWLEKTVEKFCELEKSYLINYKNNGNNIKYEKSKKYELELNKVGKIGKISFVLPKQISKCYVYLGIDILDMWENSNGDKTYVANFYSFYKRNVDELGPIFYEFLKESLKNNNVKIRFVNLQTIKEDNYITVEKEEYKYEYNCNEYGVYGCQYCDYKSICRNLFINDTEGEKNESETESE